MARVPYLQRDELPEGFRGIFDNLLEERGYVPNLYRTLAHSPALLRAFIDMTADIRTRTSLQPKLRELAILTVARLTGATIQWLSHIPLALAAGLSSGQLRALTDWERHPSFSEEERAVIRFSEAVTRDVNANDEVWQALRGYLDDRDAVELTLIVGFYNMVARFLGTMKVDVDPEYLAALGTQNPSIPT
jgi:alkylhydroperoxidase family enzyme